MTEIVSTIATTIFDHSLGVIGRQIGYLWNYKKNVNDLQMQVEDLDKERDDKSHCVTVAEKNGERIREGVKRWQNETDKISEEAKKILQEYEEKGKKMCLMDLCPNLLSRYQFGRRACKKRIEVERAITKADQIREVSDPTVGRGTTRALSTKGMFSFDSRKSTLEDIMKMLQDETKTIVGVYGLGGMGKTTLAKQVASRAADDKMFEEIAMGSVTQTVDVKEIQGQIASELGMNLSETSVAERACRIRERLKGKKVLIILDDLWKELNLEEVGIPFGVGHVGCKMLLTSRFQYVLTSMGTDKEFLLGALEEEEAWELFKKKTGNVVGKPDFLTIGKEVAKRCAGLPVMIVTVAASLSRRPDLRAWKDALKQLKKMNYKEVHDIVNSAIESISYNHLEQRHKQLFLLCGLIGGHVSMESLLQYSLGWDMFDDEVRMVEEARNRLHAWVMDLKESCLLLDGYGGNSITMHDVVREVSLSIAKKDSNMYMIEDAGVELDSWHKDDALKRCVAIVFHGRPNLSCLPQQLKCPSLELCILDRSRVDSSLTIPDTFFDKTSKLKVLDMSGLYFSALPSSLSFTKNLQTLRVNGCRMLKDISIVGELKKLQTLSFAYSNIEELPSGIGQLSELRLLDLSCCYVLKVIPGGVIASLSQLEELKMKSFDKWDVEDNLNNSGRGNVSLVELKNLPNLSNLEITISNTEVLSEDLNFERLEKYEIIVGNMWGRLGYRLSKLEFTRKVCLQLSTTTISHLQHVVKRLFKTTECLCLGKLRDIKNVVPSLDANGFPDLKHLYIQFDSEIQYIVNVEDEEHKASFPSLESLCLIDMLKLQKICNARLIKESFGNLTKVRVENCNKLESLFSFGMAKGLLCLQKIEISNCAVLEQIVAEKKREDEDVNTKDGVCKKMEFAQLRVLSLKCLPKLNKFFSVGKMRSIHDKKHQSLPTDMEVEEIISEEAEYKSSVHFFEKVSFHKLEKLDLDGIPNLSEVWSHKLQEMSCCNLTRLTVGDCDNLKYLLTPSITTGLARLQLLIIRRCARIQVVVKEEGQLQMGSISFPQLSSLYLYELPNLTTFFGEIEEMKANENPEATLQHLFNEKVKFPSLKVLVIRNLDGIKTIWPNMQTLKKDPHEILSFQTLQTLEVVGCPSLEHVIPTSVAQSLNELEELSIQNYGVEAINDEDKDMKLKETKAIEVATAFAFPKLVNLNLGCLPKLKCFYPGEHSFEWPALENLQVWGCDKIQPSLLTAFLIEKVAFSPILPSMSFKNLLELYIYDCAGLTYLLTPSIAMSLQKVKKITVKKCSMMQAIVGYKDGEATTHRIAFPQLIHLSLEDLPNLKGFYTRVREEMDSNEKTDSDIHLLFNEMIQFPLLKELKITRLDSINAIWHNQQLYQVKKVVAVTNLSDMTVSECRSLKRVFSVSTAQSLNRLERLNIEDCEVLETMVGEENHVGSSEEFMKASEQMATTFVFPKLTNFKLLRLPKVVCFYPREHRTQWPALEVLDVCGCDKVSAFDFLRIPEKQGDHQFEKVISNLKFFSITSKDVMKIQEVYGHFPQHLFRSLQELTIADFHGEAVAFPSKFLRIIHNQVEKIQVYNCSFQEMFTYEGEVIDGGILLPRLRELKLKKLPELKYICKQDQFTPFIPKVLDNIDHLRVRDCPRLTNLVPSFVSFRLLTYLTVKNCDGLINLIQPLTARSLEHLGWLIIRKCEMIEEIIGGEVRDDDEESSSCDGEIIFNKLWYLRFEELPRLANFCSSRKYTFSFPSLSKLIVEGCPNMKTFCGRVTAAPKLKEIYGDIEGCEGDLNAIIEQGFAKMEAERLATTLPSASSSNHFEEETQARKNSAEKLSESRSKGQTCHDAIDQEEKVADTFEKDKEGKFEVVEEGMKPFEKPEEIPHYSDPSCSSYAAQEQTVAGCLTSSQRVVASSTLLSPQVINPRDEVIPSLANQVIRAATVSVTNQFEMEAQIHDKSSETVEQRNEGQICRNGIEERGNKAEVCKKTTQPGKQLDVSESVTVGSLTSPHEVESSSQFSNRSEDTPRIAIMLPSTSSNGRFELTEPTKESHISKHVIDELGNKAKNPEKATNPIKEYNFCENANELKQVTEICEEVMEGGKAVDTTNAREITPCLVTQARSSVVASNFEQKDFEDFIPLISESFRALQARPMSSISAEQVQFVKEAHDWLGAYVEKATECLERNKALSELKREIAEKLAKMQALEHEIEAAASSIPNFR